MVLMTRLLHRLREVCKRWQRRMLEFLLTAKKLVLQVAAVVAGSLMVTSSVVKNQAK